MIEYEQIPNEDRSTFQRNGITWLASWPKSGNTWVRLFLSAYLRGPDNFSLTTLNLEGDSQVYMYQMHSPLDVHNISSAALWRIRPAALWTQYVLSRKTNLLLKTHCCNAKVNDYYLIPPDLTHKAVYIVRDPRDVLVSWKRYSEISWEKAFDDLTCDTLMLPGSAGTVSSFISSWAGHVKSWLDDSDLDLALLTYEGLLYDPVNGFRKVLEFLGIEVDEDRLTECVRVTSLDNLRSTEDTTGFIDNGSGERFFHKGGSRWQQELPQEYASKVLDSCGDVMERLGYLGD